MNFLILSHTHHLFPLAWRLSHTEQNEVTLVAMKDRYARAWNGLLNPLPRREATPEQWAEWRDVAASGDLVVITDSPKGVEIFEGAPRLFGLVPGGVDTEVSNGLPPLIAGGWFDGEQFALQHLVVPDWGLWPGGSGAHTMGGATLLWGMVDPEGPLFNSLAEQSDRLKSESFRGLVQVGLRFNELSRGFEGELVPGGWPLIHGHLFMSEIPMTGLYDGSAPPLPEGFVVGITVTTPPWPLVCNYEPPEVEIEGLGQDDLRSVFFHDMQAERESRKVRTAGLDGLVAVVRGTARNLGLARARALTVAGKIRLPEKQVRGDVGARVEGVLATLEELGF